MSNSSFPRRLIILLIGDAVTLALVTLVGVGLHSELNRLGVRFFPNFIPLWVGWLLLAPHLQVYHLEKTLEASSLWRPLWAMILAAPFGLWLRSLWLGTAILPVFVLVMGGISAAAILAWRSVYFLFARRSIIA